MRFALHTQAAVVLAAGAATSVSCKDAPPTTDAFRALVLTTWDPVKNPMETGMGGTKGDMLYLVLQPPGRDACTLERTVEATANGVAMKQVSKGGHLREYRFDMHGDLVHDGCPPLAFGIAKSDLPDTPDGKVSFSLRSDGLSIDSEWPHVFTPRKLELVDHPTELKVGERITLAVSPDSDAIEPTSTGAGAAGGQTGVCMVVGHEDLQKCGLKRATDKLCADGAIDGARVTFTVPSSFACVSEVALRLEHGTVGKPASCDDRFEACLTRYAPAQLRVTISP
ncbi:MAG: hypothetical protein HOV80_30260 [Polyangiaceae bacterium]|nr:hypothetical protein [Polyangiaceae bacterium]